MRLEIDSLMRQLLEATEVQLTGGISSFGQHRQHLQDDAIHVDREITQIIKGKLDIVSNRMRSMNDVLDPDRRDTSSAAHQCPPESGAVAAKHRDCGFRAFLAAETVQHLRMDNGVIEKARERLERQLEKISLLSRKVESKLKTSLASGEKVLEDTLNRVKEELEVEAGS